jgi:hypothetical protein
MEEWGADEVAFVLDALQAEWSRAEFAPGFAAAAEFSCEQRSLGIATDGRWLARHVRDISALAALVPDPHRTLRAALFGRLGTMLTDPSDVSSCVQAPCGHADGLTARTALEAHRFAGGAASHLSASRPPQLSCDLQEPPS